MIRFAPWKMRLVTLSLSRPGFSVATIRPEMSTIVTPLTFRSAISMSPLPPAGRSYFISQLSGRDLGFNALMGSLIVQLRQGEAHDRARDDRFTADMKLHAEARVDPAHLQEAATKRATGELGLAPVGEKLASAQAHDTA